MLLDRQVRLRIPSRRVPNSFCKLRPRRLEFEFEIRNWLPPLMRGGCIRRLTDWPIFVWIHLVYSPDLQSREGSNATPLKDFCWHLPVLVVVRLSFIRYLWAAFVIIWTQIINFIIWVQKTRLQPKLSHLSLGLTNSMIFTCSCKGNNRLFVEPKNV